MLYRSMLLAPLLVTVMSYACASEDLDVPTEETESSPLFDPAMGGGSSDFDECADASDQARLVPIKLYVLLDKSGSMTGPKWSNAVRATQNWIGARESGGLTVALRFFPDSQTDPSSGCDSACNVASCAQPRVPFGTLTELSGDGDPHETALLEAFAGVTPSGGTPMSAALEGGLQYVRGQVAPGERGGVILVTDGEPEDCNTNPAAFTEAATNALNTDRTLTFTIGLDGADFGLLDTIAMAGGTEAAIRVTAGEEATGLQEALAAVRESSVACAYEVPDEIDGSPVDPSLVNVTLTQQDSGEETTVGSVADATFCTTAVGGWYYDDPSDPSQILFCPSTCAAAQTGVEVELVFGCSTIPA